MQDIIRINDLTLDKKGIQAQIQAGIAQISTIDLAQTGPKEFRRTQRKSFDRIENSTSNLTYTFIELIDNTAIKEPEFRSDAPVVGHLIVKFRQIWNWMSTRWYVLPIIQQQSDVNMQMALMLMEMVQIQKSNAQHIANLEAKIKNWEEYLLQKEDQ